MNCFTFIVVPFVGSKVLISFSKLDVNKSQLMLQWPDIITVFKCNHRAGNLCSRALWINIIQRCSLCQRWSLHSFIQILCGVRTITCDKLQHTKNKTPLRWVEKHAYKQILWLIISEIFIFPRHIESMFSHMWCVLKGLGISVILESWDNNNHIDLRPWHLCSNIYDISMLWPSPKVWTTNKEVTKENSSIAWLCQRENARLSETQIELYL